MNLEARIKDIDARLARLIEMHLDGLIDRIEYTTTKENLLKKKIRASEQIGQLARGANCWVEPLLGFLQAALRAGELAESKNLEAQKDFLKTAGSNLQICHFVLNPVVICPYGTYC